MRIGYFLSCEEYDGEQVIKQARLAEEAGFESLGDEVEAHVEAFRPYAEAGFDDIHISQVGAARTDTSAEGFLEFYAEKVLPRLREL